VNSWLSSLPTEYQLTLVVSLFMLLCFFVCPLSPVLDKNLGTVITALGALALGAIAHGAVSRFGKADGMVDLKGDTHA
jgi:hypothetical protein